MARGWRLAGAGLEPRAKPANLTLPMSSKYKTHPGGLYFITPTVSGWIDLFTRAEYADMMLTGLVHCIRRKGLRVYAYVIMPSHAHLLADLTDDNALLADVLRDFKSYAAKRI